MILRERPPAAPECATGGLGAAFASAASLAGSCVDPPEEGVVSGGRVKYMVASRTEMPSSPHFESVQGTLEYAVTGSILVLRPRGTPRDEERRDIYEAIARDPRVPNGALLLVDWARMDGTTSREIERRTQLLMARLGRLIGPVCAVIVPPRLALEGAEIRRVAAGAGLRVGLFADEASARRWLSAYT